MMKRKQFFTALATLPLFGVLMKLNDLKKWGDQATNTPKMPALFIGHGHPMNALMDNQFTQRLQTIGRELEHPNAIMVVSAHWETRGTYVSTTAAPKTIHDFGRFTYP